MRNVVCQTTHGQLPLLHRSIAAKSSNSVGRNIDHLGAAAAIRSLIQTFRPIWRSRRKKSGTVSDLAVDRQPVPQAAGKRRPAAARIWRSDHLRYRAVALLRRVTKTFQPQDCWSRRSDQENFRAGTFSRQIRSTRIAGGIAADDSRRHQVTNSILRFATLGTFMTILIAAPPFTAAFAMGGGGGGGGTGSGGYPSSLLRLDPPDQSASQPRPVHIRHAHKIKKISRHSSIR